MTGRLLRQVVDALLADGIIDHQGHRMLRDDLAALTRPACTVAAHCPRCGAPLVLHRTGRRVIPAPTKRTT